MSLLCVPPCSVYVEHIDTFRNRGAAKEPSETVMSFASLASPWSVIAALRKLRQPTMARQPPKVATKATQTTLLMIQEDTVAASSEPVANYVADKCPRPPLRAEELVAQGLGEMLAARRKDPPSVPSNKANKDTAPSVADVTQRSMSVQVSLTLSPVPPPPVSPPPPRPPAPAEPLFSFHEDAIRLQHDSQQSASESMAADWMTREWRADGRDTTTGGLMRRRGCPRRKSGRVREGKARRA